MEFQFVFSTGIAIETIKSLLHFLEKPIRAIVERFRCLQHLSKLLFDYLASCKNLGHISYELHLLQGLKKT